MVGFLRSFLLLIIGSMCAYKLLFLALVLSLLFYASYFKGDISVISLKGLIKAISLFKGVKRRIFGCKLYKRRFIVFGC